MRSRKALLQRYPGGFQHGWVAIEAVRRKLKTESRRRRGTCQGADHEMQLYALGFGNFAQCHGWRQTGKELCMRGADAKPARVQHLNRQSVAHVDPEFVRLY